MRRNAARPEGFEGTYQIDVAKNGGDYNSHTHPDRADTNHPKYLAHIHRDPADISRISLIAKQKMVGELHMGPAYEEADLEERMGRLFRRLQSYGTKKLNGCIDVSPDLKDPFVALKAALKQKKRFAGRGLELHFGPHPIFGFKEGTDRWAVFEEAARHPEVELISGLPEKDFFREGTNPDGKIGFRQNMWRVLKLGLELNKPIEIHLDQSDDPSEHGTEDLIDALSWLDPHRKGPAIWDVHMISPSAYDEYRWAVLVDNLLKYKIGVRCCPQAGVSMRRPRPIMAPSHNCLARVLELFAAGVPVTLGSDNIGDFFVPACTGNLRDEVFVAANTCRFYLSHIWAKVAAGVRLNDSDRDSVKDFLRQDAEVFRSIDPNWVPWICMHDKR
jgi:cytosine/adenosine deaminase-related metal-dependent hydrolase